MRTRATGPDAEALLMEMWAAWLDSHVLDDTDDEQANGDRDAACLLRLLMRDPSLSRNVLDRMVASAEQYGYSREGMVGTCGACGHDRLWHRERRPRHLFRETAR